MFLDLQRTAPEINFINLKGCAAKLSGTLTKICGLLKKFPFFFFVQ